MAVVLALMSVCAGFGEGEVSEARDRVIDEDYQTELPEFADADPENPLSFLDEPQKQCDEASGDNCEAEDGPAGAGESKKGGDESGPRGEAGSGSGESDDSSEAETSEPGSFWDHEADADPAEPPEPPDIDIPEGLAAVLQVLGIAVLAVILLLIIWRIALAVSNRSESAEASESGVPDEAEASLRENAPTRPHADLAADDHYDEAIHRLLLDVLDQLAERQRDLGSPSLTARELLRRARIDDQTHEHLAALVRAVEEILFARRSADAARYETCLEHHRAIKQALGGRGST